MGYIGVADDPEHQRYVQIAYNPCKEGSVCIIGNSGSGKSTLVSTIVHSTMLQSETIVNFYIIDCGGGCLRKFKNVSLCGGYISIDEKKRIPMLLTYIKDLFEERRKGHCTEYYPIFLIIDNFGESASDLDEKYIQTLTDIIKYGKSINIYLVLTGQGVGAGEIPAKIISGIEKIIVLGRGESYQIASYLSTTARLLPIVEEVPGRGVVLYEDVPLMFQAYMIRSEVAYKWSNDNYIARQFPYIPDEPGIEEFMERIKTEEALFKEKYNDYLPVGYEKYSGRIYRLPLSRAPCILISGRNGTGKRTFLTTISLVAARYNIQVINVTDITVLLQILARTANETDTQDRVILLIKNLDTILCDFYENPNKIVNERIMLEWFSNSNKGNRLNIIGITEGGAGRYLQGKEIYKCISNNSYVIHFGGCMDENKMFDFSYLPYSVQSRRMSTGCAHVMKLNRKLFWGDIVVPDLPRDDSY